jgi:hypothetical protein
MTKLGAAQMVDAEEKRALQSITIHYSKHLVQKLGIRSFDFEDIHS